LKRGRKDFFEFKKLKIKKNNEKVDKEYKIECINNVIQRKEEENKIYNKIF
jgi:hypothetical protein